MQEHHLTYCIFFGKWIAGRSSAPSRQNVVVFFFLTKWCRENHLKAKEWSHFQKDVQRHTALNPFLYPCLHFFFAELFCLLRKFQVCPSHSTSMKRRSNAAQLLSKEYLLCFVLLTQKRLTCVLASPQENTTCHSKRNKNHISHIREYSCCHLSPWKCRKPRPQDSKLQRKQPRS